MKAKVLTGINAVIAALLGFLGIGCQSTIMCEYGVPHATLNVSGTITNTESQPVKNIRVSVRLNPVPEAGLVPLAVSAENGSYESELDGIFPVQTATLFADDTTGVYDPDSVVVELKYDNSGVSKSDHWNRGTATVHQNFQLKKMTK